MTSRSSATAMTTPMAMLGDEGDKRFKRTAKLRRRRVTMRRGERSQKEEEGRGNRGLVFGSVDACHMVTSFF